MDLNSRKSPFRRLVARTQAIKPDRTDLNVSLAEARQIFERMKKGEEPSEAATSCWRDILKVRALKFQREGLAGVPPYETGKSVITVASEIENLLKEDPKVMKQFSQLLSETFFTKRQPKKTAPGPYYYLDLLEVDSRATFNLGAIYLKSWGDRYQIADCAYYSSSGFYASYTLRQVWPIKIKDQNASLVWRGEFVSAPSLADRKGIEAMAAPAILLQELKKTIRAFQEDVIKAP